MVQYCQPIDEIATVNFAAVAMYGGATFPKDRSMGEESGDLTNAAIFIDGGSFGCHINQAMDVVTFASLLIFSRMNNSEFVSAWRSKGTPAIGERASATFSPNSTIGQAFASVEFDMTPRPEQLPFAIVPADEFVESFTALTFDLVGDGVRLALVSQRISELSARDFLEKIYLVVKALAAHPEILCSELPLVTGAAHSLMPDLSRAIEAESFEPVPATFLSGAKKFADKAAIVANGERYSYGELARVVSYIAAKLSEAGVRPGDTVAVSGFMSLGTVAAMIGAMAAGGVMVTVDHALPKERQKLILDISNPRFLIKIQSKSSNESCHSDEIVIPDWFSHAEIATLPECAFIPPSLPQDALAYIFFTSGSSGAPKGVQGTHLGLAHFLDWQRSNFPIGPGDRAAQITALSFDVILRDVLFPLTSGACLHLLDRSEMLDARRFLRWISENQITLMHCVPSLMKVWLKGVDDRRSFASLRLIFFAGEPLTGELLHRFVRAAGKNTTVVNLYGPTETTLAKLSFKATRIEPGVQPVGTPQPGVDVAIVRDRRSICGLWEIGEIAIRTPYRSKGYLGNDELTRQAFLPNPFGDDPSDLIYFTGDLGRLRSDGMVEIFGRIDSQIKIRGVRIEPHEVESHILKLPGVRDAAVTVHRAENDEKMLAALVVPNKFMEIDQRVEFCRLVREVLKAKLVDAMVPSVIVVAERLPYLPSGKIDRKSLADIIERNSDLDENRGSHKVENHADTSVEGQLVSGWQAIFPRQHVSKNSSFLSLEGDSLSYVSALLVLENVLKDVPRDWAGKTLRELGNVANATAKSSSIFANMESAIFIRAASILLVVAGHFAVFKYGGGATSALLFVSGAIFGKLQLPQLKAETNVRPIIKLMGSVFLPYYIFELANFVIGQIIGHNPSASGLLLYADFIDYSIANHSDHSNEYLWYVHCVIHILAAMAIAFYFFGGKFTKLRKLEILISFCIVGVFLRFVAPMLWDRDAFASGEQFWRYLPTSNLATFALGALASFARNRSSRVILSLVMLSYALASALAYGDGEARAIGAAAFALIWMPSIRVPRLMTKPIHLIAGASLFIYLLEYWVYYPFNILGLPPMVSFAAAVVCGVAAWTSWNAAIKRVGPVVPRLAMFARARPGLNGSLAANGRVD